jgi:hypothetical protein
MTQSLTALSPTFWSANAGDKFYKTTFFRAICSFKEEALVKGSGRIVDRPYLSDIVAESYVKGTAATAQDATATTDPLTLDQFYDVLMYFDDVDVMQNKYDTAKLYADEAGLRIGVKFDAHVLYEAINANSAVDDADMGGTSNYGISLGLTNIDQTFGEINEALDSLNVPEEERFLVLTPLFYNKLWQRIAGKDSMLGDRSGETGMIGTYGSLKLYKSNNVTGTARWTPGDALTPTDGETLTIEGITFTWKTTIGATAGNVLAVTDMPTSIDNLVALINNGGATSDAGVSNVSLSTANQRAVQNWVAVDGATYVTIYVKGTPSLTVTGSQTADTWDAEYTSQVCLAGRKGAINAAIQTRGNGIIDTAMASTVSAGKRGINVMPLLVGGVKTFNNDKNALVKVLIRSNS